MQHVVVGEIPPSSGVTEAVLALKLAAGSHIGVFLLPQRREEKQKPSFTKQKAKCFLQHWFQREKERERERERERNDSMSLLHGQKRKQRRKNDLISNTWSCSSFANVFVPDSSCCGQALGPAGLPDPVNIYLLVPPLSPQVPLAVEHSQTFLRTFVVL